MRLAVAAVLALGLLAAPAVAQFPPGPPPTIPRDDPDPSIANGSAQRKLDAARHRWHRAGIHNYRFSIDTICFCPQGAPQVLFVRNDRAVHPPPGLRDVATVRRLHKVVQDAIDRGVAGLSVRYDRHGVPRRIGIDGRRNVADDEITYRVPNFWRGTKGHGGPDARAPR
jgi:hypothetical protein